MTIQEFIDAKKKAEHDIISCILDITNKLTLESGVSIVDINIDTHTTQTMSSKQTMLITGVSIKTNLEDL